MTSIHDSIAEILAHNPNFGPVIQRFEIHTDQSYKLPLQEALQGLDENFILNILHLFESKKPYPIENFEHLSIEHILMYLQRTHQYYLEKRLPELENSILNICNEEEPESILRALLASFYKDFKHDLCKHISLEERELFPYIKQVISGENPTNHVLDSFANHHDDAYRDWETDRKSTRLNSSH